MDLFLTDQEIDELIAEEKRTNILLNPDIVMEIFYYRKVCIIPPRWDLNYFCFFVFFINLPCLRHLRISETF
jgi:hypothetical protein